MREGLTVCPSGMCTGCMSCVDHCPRAAIRIVDSLDAYNAVIDVAACSECGACHRLCSQNDGVALSMPVSWHQGWAEDSQRKTSSSGGIASAVAKAFVRSGGLVCTCAYADGEFRFEMYEDENELDGAAGSKYVKSNPSGSYEKVQTALRSGRKVLFIGLPCQVAPMKMAIGRRLGLRLYTVDLICHGTPSPKLLNLFLAEFRVGEGSHQSLSFRNKGDYPYGLSINGERIRARGSTDEYTAAFLKRYSLTKSCYECKYAQLARVGDLTLGDSWGSNLPREEQDKGISLCLCQNEKGKELLRMASPTLLDVDLDSAVAANGQLSSPSAIPKQRDLFFEQIKSGKTIGYSLFRCLPIYALKQAVKDVLLRWHIISI